MTAAEEEDARERWIRTLSKEIQKLLPYPVSNNQRAHLEQVIHMNLTGVGNG